jgi:hypothetical protein
MAHVRQNELDLGPFHDRVKAHCKAIVENPNLLLVQDAAAATVALNGQGWDRPDLMYRIHSIPDKLPHLRTMIGPFFEGALLTWERFTTEFAPGGAIDQATPEQRLRTWNSSTNDTSEGTSGRCRQMLPRGPNMTDNQRNARVMWR